MLWVQPKIGWRQIQPNLGVPVEVARRLCGLGVSLFLGFSQESLGSTNQNTMFLPTTLGTFATMDGRAPGAVAVVRKLQGFVRSESRFGGYKEMYLVVMYSILS